jgi:putative proteasome-type protease
MIYPQGNPLRATPESPFLQIGESKYGRPILDRAVRYDGTSLEQAAKLAIISLDSTMRSNLTVGPPIDLVVYRTGTLDLREQVRFAADDPQLVAIRQQWEQELRAAAQRLPDVQFPLG